MDSKNPSIGLFFGWDKGHATRKEFALCPSDGKAVSFVFPILCSLQYINVDVFDFR